MLGLPNCMDFFHVFVKSGISLHSMSNSQFKNWKYPIPSFSSILWKTKAFPPNIHEWDTSLHLPQKINHSFRSIYQSHASYGCWGHLENFAKIYPATGTKKPPNWGPIFNWRERVVTSIPWFVGVWWIIPASAKVTSIFFKQRMANLKGVPQPDP